MTCDHASIAVAANKAHADGLGDDSSDSDVDEDYNDEVRLLAVARAAADGRDLEAAGAVELPPHLPSSSSPVVPINRFKWQSRSAESRHLVPPRVAQRERADLTRARRHSEQRIHYPAGSQCPFCLVGRSPKSHVVVKNAKVEFEDGVVPATVERWRCHKCLFRVLPDGVARGVIFHSSYTVYSEAFLFEVAVNLARNGTSLHATAYLREAFTELHTGCKFPPSGKRMRSVTTLRKALLLYLACVIKGLPCDTVSCATCRRPDGSYAVVSFDGLQLGYKVKYKKAFFRTSINIHAVPRASRAACLITDGSVAKALGRVLSSKRDDKTVASSIKAITTVTTMRGHVMAVTLLLGNIAVGGVEQTFSGSRPHLDGSKKERGWDPIVDGGASVELVALLRGLFDVRRSARSLALTILDASYDLRRRVPALLMGRINELVTDPTPPPAARGLSWVAPSFGDGGGDGDKGNDADLHEADAERRRKRARRTTTTSTEASTSSSGDSTSDGDVFASEDDGFNVPPPVKTPAPVKWDKGAPLLSYGEALDEPALGTKSGVTGEEQRLVMRIPFLPHVPGTAASMLKVLEFVRAVTVDPVFVWAPQGSWAAVDAVLGVLLAEDFSVHALAAVLRSPAVKEQRLLRGAVACLGPGLEAHTETRKLLAAVLKTLKRRVVEYDQWVGDGGGVVALSGAAVEATRHEMASAHPLQTFFHKAYTSGWLLPPASVATYRSVYGEYTDQWDDYLRTGVWAPGPPTLRPTPGFSGAATANRDLPDCNHLMGAENSHTGGTVGAFCTCSHPKCLGVIVLTGSESQRMPLEFVAQRFVKMPLTIIYDFACATLQSALVRLP